MAQVGVLCVPLMIFVIIGYGYIKGINVFSVFKDGCSEGVKSVYGIFPSLFALFIAVSVFRASGLVEFISHLLSPVCEFLHFPPELLPFALLRPVSGSGSLALASDIFTSCGTDSFIGRCASVMMASTETTLYVAAVYFGASKTKNIRHSLKCGLLADLFSMIMSIIVCSWYF
ncbi:MAG: spore maturation protein [Clostridia bacterium]|nr:spore maturation protein [Clostridia bacterium]